MSTLLLRQRPDHVGAAAEAQVARGVWVLAGVYERSASATAAAHHMPRLAAYQPPGAFEAYAAPHEEGTALWVRYVAGDAPVPPLLDRMTVRLRHEGPGRAAVGVITVTVSALCPTCGGPRGYETITPQRFRHDGDYYVVDRWTNRCGHADTHPAVLRESRENQLEPGPPVLPPEPVEALGRPARLAPPAADSPAGVVLRAADEWRGMRARAAIQVLEKHGFPAEAERVRNELRVRDAKGRMSARQIAHWLHTGGDAR